MAKDKTTTAATVVEGLDARLQSVFAKLPEADQAEILKMDLESQIDALELFSSLAASVTVGNDITFKDAKPKQEKAIILSPGGVGCRPGTKFRVFLEGTVHINTADFKENWKEKMFKGKQYFYNCNYKFRDAVTGKEFGIWSSPSLRVLEKIPTHAATPHLVKADPMIELEYIGKIEGKEILSKEHGIELTKGNSSHVFKVRVADNVVYNAYKPGCVNSLNPIDPYEGNTDGPVSRDDATRSNYERMMALQAGGNDVAGLLAQ